MKKTTPFGINKAVFFNQNFVCFKNTKIINNYAVCFPKNWSSFVVVEKVWEWTENEMD